MIKVQWRVLVLLTFEVYTALEINDITEIAKLVYYVVENVSHIPYWDPILPPHIVLSLYNKEISDSQAVS